MVGDVLPTGLDRPHPSRLVSSYGFCGALTDWDSVPPTGIAPVTSTVSR